MLRLIKAEVSRGIIYPGNPLYITTTFQAENDCPISEYAEIFCDMEFGYMTLPECYQRNYRIKGNFYPQPMHIKKGETITNTICWHIPADPYAGTFRMNIGVCDADSVPIKFVVDDKEYTSYYIGDIEVAFKGCAPKFVNSHTDGLIFEYSKKEIKNYNDTANIEIYVRDLKNDTVFVDKSKSKFVDFTLNENNGKIVLDNVTEKEGYELLSVKMPTLIKAPGAKIISTAAGGRLIDSKNTVCLGYEKKFNQKNLGILIDNDEYIMLECPYLDECIHYSVYEKNNVRYAAVGVTFTYRIRKHNRDRSVKVINKPTANIMRTKDLKDILKFLRGDLKRPNDFYDRGILYYTQIYCDGSKENNTFLQALERVKLLYNMTGGVKQTVLLRGFQHNGHDTGYPDVFTLNKEAGTADDLRYAIEQAKKYNAVITFHDNYDDLYEELPAYDETICALDEYNLPYKGWIWVSGLSRIISAPKYVKSGKMAERVKKTLNMYPVKSSYHLDVLSCEARRYDLDENVRMAAQEFVEYKKLIVKEFQKYGFNVTSEGVSMPFAGLIGHAWNINALTYTTYPNETFFPVLGMIFHSILPFSGHFLKNDILSGAEIVPEIGGDFTQYYKEQFYLCTLPMGMLCNLTLDGYTQDGDICTAIYSDNSKVVFNGNTNEITVIYQNKVLSQNGNALVLGFNDGEYLGYTKNGDYSFETPFKDDEIKQIFEIDFCGEKEQIPYNVNNGLLTVKAKPDTAFKIILK